MIRCRSLAAILGLLSCVIALTAEHGIAAQPGATAPATVPMGAPAPDGTKPVVEPLRLLAASDLLLPSSEASLTSGHAWLVLPVSDTDADLLHLPPRDGSTRVSSGSVRAVLPIKLPLSAIAAWDGRVFIVGGSPVAKSRPVQSFIASARLAEGSWQYAPNGRFETLDSLPGPGTLLSLIGSRHGLATVTRDGAGVTTLRVLDADGWITVALPPAAVNAQEVHLLADDRDLVIAHRSLDSQSLVMHRGLLTRTVDRVASAKPEGDAKRVVSLTPEWRDLPPITLPADVIAREITTGEGPGDWWLARVDGRCVLAQRQPTSLRIWRLTTGPAAMMPPIATEDSAIGFVGLSGLERVSMLSATIRQSSDDSRQRGQRQPLGRPAPDPASLTVREISLASGAVFQTQTAHTDPPLTRQDLQSLWLVLLLIGGTVLIVVIRSDGGQGPVVLPPNASLATPGRRLVAGLVDICIAAAIVGAIMGKAPAQVFSPVALAAAPVTPLLALLAAGFAHTLLSEAVFGRSLGKWSVSIRVSGMRRTNNGWVPSQASAAQAFIRNMVKWFLPPVGLMMFIDPNLRHAGDILSRTVVVRDDPPAEMP